MGVKDMDLETRKKRIIDLSHDELINLGFLGDEASVQVKRIVESVKASPAHLGNITCFMVECVKDQFPVPVRRHSQHGIPSSSRIPTPPDPPARSETLSRDASDAHEIVPPHLISKFERKFYYYGISSDPPELLYRSDLDTNKFYIPPPGARFSKLSRKIPNGVFDSPLNAVWDVVAPQIIASMKNNGVRWSALTTVRFTTVYRDDEASIGPVVIWIAVRPGTMDAQVLRDFTPNIMRILSNANVNEEGAVVVEWYEGEVTKLSGSPSLMPMVHRMNPRFGLNHPFNAALGIPVARQTDNKGEVEQEGTIAFLFKEVKTRDGAPSSRVLAVTNKHVVFDSESERETQYRFDGTNQVRMLVCGGRQYERAVNDLMDAVIKGARQVSLLEEDIEGLRAKEGTADEDSRSLGRVIMALKELEEHNAVRQTLVAEATTEWKDPNDRVFGVVDYGPEISAGPDGYTLDVATVDVDPAKLEHFESNIVDLGDQFDAIELESLFWPVDVEQCSEPIPANMRFPVLSASPRRLVVSPNSEDTNGEPLYVLAKWGSTTHLTLGRYSGMDAYVCDAFGVESREVAVYNYSSTTTKAGRTSGLGDFAGYGDSGALIFTGHREAFAMLHSGIISGESGTTHVTFGTPVWCIVEEILKEYPHANFFGMTHR
ncbi:hypothetical protein CYLTODRAFT_371021 [Cylindrobasidium torrendii FP15055 ss-10]|uniref:Uncharacterized protein n=1 Tax=Cylindrobasidium torrendii FP15055 ss-10 TaxID=1314674 RepID=A0A0D7BK13_9AGAR|nr:hypothetical protein CYLTODRAFT_371021 [Cylindrobasidium torrendii FP15055 ss-10]